MRVYYPVIAIIVFILLVSTFCLSLPTRKIIPNHMELEFNSSSLQGGIVHYTIIQNGSDISFKTFIDLLSEKPEFALQLSKELKKHKFAYFFETPSISQSTLERTKFEFVIVPAPGLENIDPDTESFDGRVNNDTNFATNFYNLGKDAMLVIPCRPKNGGYDDNTFSHLSNFIQGATDDQLIEVWSLAGKSYRDQIASENVRWWFSTSGLGVYWLHIRICRTPKYYHYRPFANSKN